nr:pancreatic lipase-related protein 2-like [Lytechinus pictus]
MMLASLFIAALVSLALIKDGKADSVTYGDLGTFEYGNGAPICHHFRPESPDSIVIRYWLYTNNNRNYGQQLDRTSSSSITRSSFSASRDTKFVIHGYTDEYTSGWAMDMKDALLTEVQIILFVISFFFFFFIFSFFYVGRYYVTLPLVNRTHYACYVDLLCGGSRNSTRNKDIKLDNK